MKLLSHRNATLGTILLMLMALEALAVQEDGSAATASPDGATSSSEVVLAPNPPAADAETVADEAGLRDRVKSRWNALIKRDFHAAYEYASPSYRRLYSAQQFAGIFGHQLVWKQAVIRSVKSVGDNAANVTVRVTILSPVGSDLGNLVESGLVVVESWIRDEGQWWFVPKQ